MIRRETQIKEFLLNTEFSTANLQPLAGDASARRYVRAISGEKKAIIMDTPAEGENFPAFVAIAEYLKKNGYNSPQIIARNMQEGFLLLEDFGNNSFTNTLNDNPKSEPELYKQAVDLLIDWQKLSPKNSISLPLYDEQLYLREVSLFCDWYMPQILGEEKATYLRSEYLEIWREILSSAQLAQNIFVHRDFHADNLMWLPEKEGIIRVGLLDFQDAVIGDPAYDMVSLLEDARRDVPYALALDMLDYYLANTGADKKIFYNSYNILGAQRNSKIIGIFMRLALRDGKENYLNFLPRVWKHLEKDISHPSLKNLQIWIDKNIPQELRNSVVIRQEHYERKYS